MININFRTLEELLVFNIKYYRYLNNLSQEKLAELSGLSPRYISDIERMIHMPTIYNLEKIAHALRLEPYKLFKNVPRDFIIVSKIKSNRQYNQKLH